MEKLIIPSFSIPSFIVLMLKVELYSYIIITIWATIFAIKYFKKKLAES